MCSVAWQLLIDYMLNARFSGSNVCWGPRDLSEHKSDVYKLVLDVDLN